MPMLSFRATDEFVAELDERRGDLGRASFLRLAVVHYIQSLENERMQRRNLPQNQPRAKRAPTPIATLPRRAPGHLPRCTCGVCKPVKRPK